MPSAFFVGSPWEALWDPAVVTQRFVLDAEDLPRLREHLELRLKVLGVAEEASAQARRRIEANLKDIAIAEQTLRGLR